MIAWMLNLETWVVKQHFVRIISTVSESHKKCHEEQIRRTENLSRKNLESEVGK